MTLLASAHLVLGIGGFSGGLLHPLLVPLHFFATAALGLLIGQQHWPPAVPAIYLAGVVAGLGAIALAYVPTLAEETLLALAAVAGLLVALARPLSWLLGAPLATAIGVALALDSPPEAISLFDANLALLGTALGAAVVPVAAALMVRRLGRDWQRIGVRILGSWIAASAILVLALRLMK